MRCQAHVLFCQSLSPSAVHLAFGPQKTFSQKTFVFAAHAICCACQPGGSLAQVDGKKQWRITDDDNIKYAPFDWLVVSSAELASPYSQDSALFGQTPPLARAAETINHPELNDAITGIAGGKPDGVISLIYAFQSDAALSYQRLPCVKCRLDDHGTGKGVLEYMVVQKRQVPEGMAPLTFVVFQSTKEFAAEHMAVCEQASQLHARSRDKKDSSTVVLSHCSPLGLSTLEL